MSDRFYPVSKVSVSSRDIECVTDAIKSGWVSSLGSYIDAFERGFAKWCGTEFAVSVSNGTTALHLALLACGINPGDEVIIPDFTFVATANAVRHAGAVPVIVDVDRETLCISPERIREALTPRTRAIIPVHIYGHPANMPAIMAIAATSHLAVVEDAAEAHGAEIAGRRAGSLGHCGVFSFYGNKIITSGEGGMLTTNDPKINERARHLRDHAMSKDRRYYHDEVGFNYRMTNLQAALGVAQLERVEQLIAARETMLARYERKLGGHPRLKLNRRSSWAKTVVWMICVEVEGLDDAKRRRLMADLKARGVDSRPYFCPLSDMPMYESVETPVTHGIWCSGLNLPSYPELTASDIDFIGETFLDVLERCR